jgi:alanyl-tRNA synthetase
MPSSSHEIRQQFLDFFIHQIGADHRHEHVSSSPVVPHDDPTLLFTNAGMNQFKPIFLGVEKPKFPRVVNSQKCIRVSGKHNDLEEVGHDNYHHTFFEMLGNWSFGDYYKKEAIAWAWELLTKVWGLPKDRLYATVYKEDDESFDLWKRVTNIDPAHVLRFGEKDNFWEMGETGPCGPCSEIHMDLTPNGDGGKLVNAGSPEVIELWNLVFIQYNRHADRRLVELPAKHIDTGAGFERLCRVLLNKQSNYDIDIFGHIIQSIGHHAKKNYQECSESSKAPFRVIADHIRMLTFSITDGAIPGNDGRGYVLRRLLRRAALYGRRLDMHEPFIHKLVSSVVESMSEAFPEIKQRQAFVEKVIKTEEENFNKTLDRGIEVFEDMARKLEAKGLKEIPGAEVFKLYDTYGFPADLTRVMADERGLRVDENKFAEEMTIQKQRSREEGKKVFISKDVHWTVVGEESKTRFIGYDMLEADAHLIKFHRDGDLVQLVFDQTPFYAESGGQVGDKGFVRFNGTSLEVWDTQRVGDDIVHFIDDLSEIDFEKLDRASLTVAPGHRHPTIKNHTATHLLHGALRKVLGNHVHQAGSVVEPNRLRFDFTHFEKISAEELAEIEHTVHQKIFENLPLKHHRDIPIAEAKKMGALSFFGDKYGDRVNVVEFGDFSKEFCGGTHAPSTGFIGFFKIVSESSIASGVRRIEAVTGEEAERAIQSEHAIHEDLKSLLNCRTEEIVAHVGILLNQKKELEKEINRLNLKMVSVAIDGLIADAKPIKGMHVVASKIDLPSGIELKDAGDRLREKLKTGVGVLASTNDDKVMFVCVVTDDLIREKKYNASYFVKEIAKIAGGSGGGRAHLATAGANDKNKVDEALHNIFNLIK